MKKIIIPALMLLLAVSIADAANWDDKPAEFVFNDCPDTLKVVKYGLHYITGGENQGEAAVFVTVHPKTSVLLGCAYFKVYGPTGNLIYREKIRLEATAGIDHNTSAYVPADAIGSSDIRAEIGVGCDCDRLDY